MYYFKSSYDPCTYSPNWYGTLDLAPNATVIIYDDNQHICIGYVDSQESAQILNAYPSISAYTSQDALDADLRDLQIEDANVWYGERLSHRWDVIEDGE